jgi:hypothetical protein
MYHVTWPCIDGSSCIICHDHVSMVGNVIYQIMPWIRVIGALVHPYGPKRFHCPLLLWSIDYMTEQCCHSSVGDHTVYCDSSKNRNTLLLPGQQTSLLNALQLSIVLNPIEKISWVIAVTYNEASHCLLDLLLTEWLSMISSTPWIYERYTGSVVYLLLSYIYESTEK